jgi:hypothetical protein
MSDLEFLEKQAREVKEIGHTSKFMVPINQFLEIAEKARKWDATPSYIRDVVDAVRAK